MVVAQKQRFCNLSALSSCFLSYHHVVIASFIGGRGLRVSAACDLKLAVSTHFDLFVLARVQDLKDVLSHRVLTVLTALCLNQNLDVTQLAEVELALGRQRIVIQLQLLNLLLVLLDSRTVATAHIGRVFELGWR